MYKCILTTILAIITLANIDAQIELKKWTFQTDQDIKQIKCFKSNYMDDFTLCNTSEAKAPDNNKSLEIDIISSSTDANEYSKQLNFVYDFPLDKNLKYQIEFWCKGTTTGKVIFSASQFKKPYKSLGKGGTKDIMITSEWQRIKLAFSPSKNCYQETTLPRMAFGKYPKGNKLYLSPIKFSITETFIPLAINPKWELFVNVKNSLQPASFRQIPAEITGPERPVQKQTISPINNTIDIAKLTDGPKNKASALLFNEFECPKAGVMQIGTAADWWFEFTINGQTIYNTYKQGNISHQFCPKDHVFIFPVRKGKNLISIKVLSGLNGWKFVYGKVPFQAFSGKKLIKIEQNTNWKAIDMSKIQVKPGTALDFSTINGKRQPAGELGRVIVNSKGQLAFEKAPEQRVKMMAFNSWMPRWNYKFHNWSKKDIEVFATAAARQGYNMIRFQGINRLLFGNKIFKKPFVPLKEANIPLKAEDIKLDPDTVDRFHYLIHCLKQNGIYLNIELMFGVKGYTTAHAASTPKHKYFMIQLLFNPIYRQHWKVAIKHLLNQQNPYTGMNMKDDPAIAILEPLNEQDIRLFNATYMAELTLFFKTYLEEKYKTNKALQAAWHDTSITFSTIPDINEKLLRVGDTKSNDAGHFLIKAMTDLTVWYFDLLREMGYPGLVTQWDMIIRTMEIPVRALMPIISQHAYFAHPGKIQSDNLVKKSKHWVGPRKMDVVVHQNSSINSSYFRASAVARFLDRPFLITEYSHGAFNRYRHERGLYYGSYAALQGWDSLTCHGTMASNKYLEHLPIEAHENSIDPISRASEVVANLAWFRGDVKEAPHSIQFTLSSKSLFPKHFLSAVGDDYAQLAMLTKTGIAYPEVKPLSPVGKVKPDLVLPLTEFSNLKTTQWFVKADTSEGKKLPALLKKIRAHNILPETNKTDISKKIFQSETGEITLDGKQETMTVITPRLEGAIIKSDIPVILDNVTINTCSKPAAVTLASLNRNSPVSTSKRLLFTVATNALNSGMTFQSPSRMIEIGKLPVLMETVTVSIELSTSNTSKPNIYALNLDGTHAEELPCTLKNGKLSVRINTAQLKYATPFFEIVFP